MALTDRQKQIAEEVVDKRRKEGMSTVGCALAAVEAILVEQARAAEQGQACTNCGHHNPHTSPAGDVADACNEADCNCGYYTPAQPPAGDVVERMCDAYEAALLHTEKDSCTESMAAALAVAREGYVSLDDVEKKSIALIAKERERQIKGEGWTLDHDDAHKYGELAAAASCYAHHANCQARKFQPSYLAGRPSDWPWDAKWWKPSVYPVRNLVKAGALIAAEIDRLARLAKPAARVAVEHYLKNPNRWVVLLDGANPASSYFYSLKDAERYAAGLREELKAGKH